MITEEDLNPNEKLIENINQNSDTGNGIMEVDVTMNTEEKSLDAFLTNTPTTLSLFYGYFPPSPPSMSMSSPESKSYLKQQNGLVPDAKATSQMSSQLSLDSIEDGFIVKSNKTFGNDKNGNENIYEMLQIDEEKHLYGCVIDKVSKSSLDTENDLIMVEADNIEAMVIDNVNNGKGVYVETVEHKESIGDNNISNTKEIEEEGGEMANGNRKISFIKNIDHIEGDSNGNSLTENKGRDEGAYKTPAGKNSKEGNSRCDVEEVGVNKDRAEGMHLVICHHSGSMNIISLDTLQSVFKTESLGLLPQSLPMSSSRREDKFFDEEEGTFSGRGSPRTPHTPATPRTPFNPLGQVVLESESPRGDTPLNKIQSGDIFLSASGMSSSSRVLVDARIIRLGNAEGPYELTRLCLVLVLESSDVVVYYLVENDRKVIKDYRLNVENRSDEDMDMEIDQSGNSYFVKLEHSVVSRKRKIRNRKRGHSFSSSGEMASSGNNMNSDLSSYFPDSDDINPQRINLAQNIDGKISVLVSGSRPIMISNDNGIPFLSPIGMPELPFSNSGTYLLAPLSVGGIRGLASLWIENDDETGITS